MSLVNINNLIYLKYNYEIDPSKKYNVLSICLFKMKKSYKNFNLYVNKIKEIMVKNQFKENNFVIRLYYDNSLLYSKEGKDLLSILKKENHQLVEYNCPLVRTSPIHHDGTFGTLVRYLPFFDFPENDVNCCMTHDADDAKLELSMCCKILKNKDAQFLYTHWACHKPHYTSDNEDFILGSRSIATCKLPIHLLIDFIKNAKNGQLPVSESILKKIAEKNTNGAKFFYGIDEIFLERIVKKYLVDTNIKTYRISNPSFRGFSKLLRKIFANILDDSVNKNSNTQKQYRKIIQTINKKFDTTFQDLDDFIQYFKNYDWSRTTNMNVIYMFFYNEIKNLYESPHTDIIIPTELSHFLKINKFYDDTNNIEQVCG